MAAVTIYFEFSNGDGHTATFEGCSGVGGEVSDYADNFIVEHYDDSPEEVELIEYYIVDTETEYTDESVADAFDNLDDWGEYCDLVEKHGEAFVMRHADWSGHNDASAMDDYHGCWSSIEEYAQNFYEDCYGSDNPLFRYVDWENYARDLLMGMSSYEGDEGIHVFSN